jgi:tight adherence protein B
MEGLNSVFGNPWIAYPAFSSMISIIVFMWYDRVVAYLSHRSLGQREEVIRLLELMFVEVDRKRVTLLMVMVSFGLRALCFLVLWPRATLGLIIGSVVTVSMWSVPLLFVRRKWEQRCDRFVVQMVDGLTIMANGIKAGLSVTQSMERVSDNLPNPISQEFNLVLSQIRLGRSVEEALLDLGERIPKPDVQMYVTSINILKETGGNLAETFSTIVVVIRERQKIERKIEAMTAQGIMQGIMVSMIPFLILALFYFTDPGYLAPMFNTTLGIIMLIIMLGLQILGGIAIRKVVTIKV